MLAYISQNNIPIISIFFIFAVFPLSLFIYYDFKDRHKDKVLLVISVIFIAIIAIKQLPILLIIVGVNYLLYRKAAALKERSNWIKTLWLALVAGANLLLWAVSVNVGEVLGYPYLLGCGVVPFLAIRTIITEYKSHKDYSFTDYALYLLFFPRLFVGPFDTIDDFYKNKNTDNHINKQIFDGSITYLLGALQFTFLGVRLLNLAETLSSFTVADATILSRWTAVFAFAIGIYHTIGGVVNAASGIAHAYGLKMVSGWELPYNSSSIIGFSRRFNGTLERVLRNSFSFNGKKNGEKPWVKIIFALFSGGILGLWLDFSLPFMAWGMGIMALAIIELYILKDLLKKIPRALSRALTLFLLALSFAFLCSAYYNWDGFFLRLLFSTSTSFANDISVYYLTSYAFILLVGILLSTDIVHRVVETMGRKLPKVVAALKPILLIALIIIATALII